MRWCPLGRVLFVLKLVPARRSGCFFRAGIWLPVGSSAHASFAFAFVFAFASSPKKSYPDGETDPDGETRRTRREDETDPAGRRRYSVHPTSCLRRPLPRCGPGPPPSRGTLFPRHNNGSTERSITFNVLLVRRFPHTYILTSPLPAENLPLDAVPYPIGGPRAFSAGGGTDGGGKKRKNASTTKELP